MKSLFAVPIMVFAALACAGVGEKTDSTKVIPVDDINARDTTPSLPPPKTSVLTLMDSVPNGGVCDVQRYRPGADAARTVTYQTSSPRRTYVIEVGRPPRVYLPHSIDIRGETQGSGLTETENVFVGFTADGKASVGTRRYMSTGVVTANEREPLRYTDSAQALAFVQKIMDLCDSGR